VYADREFATGDTIVAFEEHNLKYLIPVSPNERTKMWVKRNVDMERGIIRVKQEWVIHSPVRGDASNEKVTTTLIVVPGELSE